MFFSSLKEYEGMKPGLSRIKKFLKAAGNPQDEFKSVHIAGTNGKGSTASFISGILTGNGYKTGLYTSPHLIDITERVKISGKDIPKKSFVDISKKYLPLAQQCGLTYFEYLTAIAFIYFAKQKVDIAVIETGLGGRFDATNAIKKPLLSIITSINFDHKEILGGTIEKIAYEKAGIIKKNVPVICGKLPKKALFEIEKKSKPAVYGKEFKAVNIKTDKKNRKQIFNYISGKNIIKNVEIALLGKHQIQNAAVALRAAEVLSAKGFKFYANKIKTSLASVKWPARFDVRRFKNTEIVIDGSHNAEGIDSFVKTWKEFYKSKAVLVFAMMKEKEYKTAVKKLVPVTDKVILVRMQNSRAVRPEILKEEFEKYIPQNEVLTAHSPAEALKMLKKGEKASALGSLYLAGEILKIIDIGDKNG